MATAHRWFINEGGAAKGPFSHRDIQRLLDQGSLALGAMICPEGSEDWRAAASVFGASPEKKRSRRSFLGVFQLTLSGLGLIAFGIFLYGANEAYAETRLRLDLLKEELQEIRGPGRFTPLDQVTNQCFGVHGSMTCTFTNLENEPLFTCAQGHLQNKEVPALRLTSQTLCSGKLLPGETKAVSAPWIGGFADDICNKETSFGKNLDWKKCDFDVAGISADGKRL